jgi:hypothetical protein
MHGLIAIFSVKIRYNWFCISPGASKENVLPCKCMKDFSEYRTPDSGTKRV